MTLDPAPRSSATPPVRGMVPGAELAVVTRRDEISGASLVESVHTGHLVVTGADGAVLGAIGDGEVVTYVRSAAKPFQAAACLEVLGPAGVTPSPAETAVAWASHRAEPRHLAAVRDLLARSGTAPEDLTCIPSRGHHEPGAPLSPLRSDCSGKHALFALLADHLGVARDEILRIDGPVQRIVLAGVEEAIGPLLAVGIDGCGAPAVAVPLVSLARGFAALATEARYEAVREAGLTHPGLVGGTGRLETALLASGVVAKVGAEGCYGIGWVGSDGQARGLAAKAADGDARGSAAAVIGLLAHLGVVPADTWEVPPPLGGGRPVGQVHAASTVHDLARRLQAVV